MACQVGGVTPAELFRMDELERSLLIQSAMQLEQNRWKRLGKMLGG